MDQCSYKNRLTTTPIQVVFVTLGLVSTGIVGSATFGANGLEWLFLLPLSFSIACALSRHVIGYARDSFGLVILYGLLILRYVVSPSLIAVSGSLVSSVSTSASGLRFAIFIMITELVIVVSAVRVVWKSDSPKDLRIAKSKRFKMTWTGFMVVVFLVALIMYRGTFPNIVEHLSFGTRFAYSYSDLQTYDMSAFMTIKAFLFLVVVSWTSSRYLKTTDRSKRNWLLLIAMLAALGNALVYDSKHRGTMVMCSISSISVLLHCYRKEIRRLLPVIAVLGFGFVWSLFSWGTLGIKDGQSLFDRSSWVIEVSRVAELYSNGVSMEAHAHDMYDTIRSRMGVETYVSEIIKSNNIFTLPGLWSVGRLVEPVPSVQSLFNSTLRPGDAFILPNAGLAMYLGSEYLGFLLNIIFHWLIVIGIHYFYRKRLCTTDISKIYLYSYCEQIFAFALMNNIMLALSLLTAVPFLLYVLLKLNSVGDRVRLR